MNIELLATKDVLHRASVQGPRVSQLQLLNVNGTRQVVELWTNPNGSVCKVSAPRDERTEDGF